MKRIIILMFYLVISMGIIIQPTRYICGFEGTLKDGTYINCTATDIPHVSLPLEVKTQDFWHLAEGLFFAPAYYNPISNLYYLTALTYNNSYEAYYILVINLFTMEIVSSTILGNLTVESGLSFDIKENRLLFLSEVINGSNIYETLTTYSLQTMEVSTPWKFPSGFLLSQPNFLFNIYSREVSGLFSSTLDNYTSYFTTMNVDTGALSNVQIPNNDVPLQLWFDPLTQTYYSLMSITASKSAQICIFNSTTGISTPLGTPFEYEIGNGIGGVIDIEARKLYHSYSYNEAQQFSMKTGNFITTLTIGTVTSGNLFFIELGN